MLAEEQVRARAERALGCPIPEPIWRDVVEDGYVREVQEGYDGAFRSLVDRCKRLMKLVRECSTAAGPATAGRQREIPSDRRLLALSRILAAEAERLPEVVKFRQEVLGGKLLTPEEVPGWIARRIEEDGHRSAMRYHPLPDEDDDLRLKLKKVRDGKVLESWEHLAYAVPGDEWRHIVAIREGVGALGRLKALCDWLRRRYDVWQEAQTVGFVLCGQVPLIPRARLTFTVGVVPRLTLNLDPRLPVNEVARIYAHHRQGASPGQGGHPIGEKNLSLAVFVVESERPGATWGALMAEWNRAHPEWAYSDRRLFARDARASIKRITGRDFRDGGYLRKNLEESLVEIRRMFEGLGTKRRTPS